MTLEEAIKHCKDVALSCTNKECALEHFQLLKWLQEYNNMLEKQGEQKPVIEMKSAEESLGISSEEYNDIVNECIYGESNFSDKVEPKFKVGDIVQYITDSTDRRKIEEVDELCNMYHTDSSPIMFEVEDEWKIIVLVEDVEHEPKFNVGDWITIKE